MKRTPVVLAVVAVAGLAAAAVIVASAGGHETRPRAAAASPAGSSATEVDASRRFDREILERQAKAQADQMLRAQDELAVAVKRKAEKATKRHELRVTIRDKPALDDPGAADAYAAQSGSECLAVVWGEDSKQIGELVVSAPDVKDELRVLKTFGLPASARLLPDGTCEASMTISLPYATRYVLGVGIMGRGIAPENAPEPPVVVTKGDSQSVVVVK